MQRHALRGLEDATDGFLQSHVEKTGLEMSSQRLIEFSTTERGCTHFSYSHEATQTTDEN
jgi:hypothetical protein